MPRFDDRRIIFLYGGYTAARPLKDSLLARDYQIDVIDDVNETTLSHMLSQQRKSYKFAIIYFSVIKENPFVEKMMEEFREKYEKIKVFGVTCGKTTLTMKNCDGVFFHDNRNSIEVIDSIERIVGN